MKSKKLSPEAIFDFMKVYYKVFGKAIPYEQAEKEAHILMRYIHLAITSHEIRTGKKLLRQRNTKVKKQN